MDTTPNLRSLFIFEGVLFMIFGLLAIAFPIVSTLGFELFIGWLLLITGIIQAYRSFQIRDRSGVSASFLTSLIYMVVGALLILYPRSGVLSLTLLFMIFFIVQGITKIILGLQFQPTRSTSWWMIISGLLSIAIAAIIWSGWPGTAYWVLGLLIGIDLVFFGSALVGLGLALPKLRQ